MATAETRGLNLESVSAGDVLSFENFYSDALRFVCKPGSNRAVSGICEEEAKGLTGIGVGDVSVGSLVVIGQHSVHFGPLTKRLLLVVWKREEGGYDLCTLNPRKMMPE
jgi:hypothetical protein